MWGSLAELYEKQGDKFVEKKDYESAKQSYNSAIGIYRNIIQQYIEKYGEQ